VSGRILIVDDEPANILLLEAFLENAAVEIRGLSDSRQVEQVFTEFEPDLVLLDLHMPDPDGLEILRRLRSARESLGYLPVVMLTGDTGKVARNSALILGLTTSSPSPSTAPRSCCGCATCFARASSTSTSPRPTKR